MRERIDCLVSIKRVGRIFDGTPRSMRAMDKTDKTALWCLANDDSENTILIDQVYPSIEKQFQMLENMILMDCCDCVLGKPVLSVDGLPWGSASKNS